MGYQKKFAILCKQSLKISELQTHRMTDTQTGPYLILHYNSVQFLHDADLMMCSPTCTCIRGIGRNKFLGGQKGWKQNSSGSGGHSPQTLKGISHFCNTFIAVFTKLVSN